MKQVVAYCRVSTDNQAQEDKFGLPAQKEMIEKYCQEHDMEIVKWYIDEGKSGAYEEGRDELNSIIYGTEVNNPPIECMVCAKSDRIARDIKLYFYYKHMLLKRGIELKSVAEDFGEFGVFASILESFVMFSAEQERMNITARTSGGRKMKAKQGGYSGGKPPYGYYVSNGKLEIKEEEAEVVRIIFEKKMNGGTYQSIIDYLTSNGYKTRKGKDFVISTIQSVLNNQKLYEGYYKYSDCEMVKGEHEAILKKF
jgi:DNA invertase Pin-like site-specific DNA recombinase